MGDDATVALTPRAAAALLRASMAAIRAEVEALPPEVHAWHPEPGEWCAKEIVGHLIEAEGRGFAGRIRAILAATGAPPRFATWDQDAVARARNDCARDASDLVGELTGIREASVALVAGLHGADYGRGGEHPTVGFLRIEDLLHEWVHHDRNHLKQILANVQGFVWPHLGHAQRFSRPGS